MRFTSKQLIDRTVKFVQNFFQKESTGHDWWHTYRVKNLALKIATEEGANTLIVELSALLHDVGDYKFFNGNENKGKEFLGQFLDTLYLPPGLDRQILNIASNISYMKSISKEKDFSSNEKIADNDKSDTDNENQVGVIAHATGNCDDADNRYDKDKCFVLQNVSGGFL